MNLRNCIILPYMHIDTNATRFNARYTVIMIMICSIYEDYCYLVTVFSKLSSISCLKKSRAKLPWLTALPELALGLGRLGNHLERHFSGGAKSRMWILSYFLWVVWTVRWVFFHQGKIRTQCDALNYWVHINRNKPLISKWSAHMRGGAQNLILALSAI